VGHNVCLAPTGWKAFSTSELRAKDVKADDPGKITKEEADVKEEANVKEADVKEEREKEEGGKDEGEKEQHHKPVDARTRLLDASLKHVVTNVTPYFPTIRPKLVAYHLTETPLQASLRGQRGRTYSQTILFTLFYVLSFRIATQRW
jgi:hypothetical protein